MKVGVIGATGKAGRRIARECRARGMDVLEIVRDPARADPDISCLRRTVLDLSQTDVKGLDVVVSAVGFPVGMEIMHYRTLVHLTQTLNGTGVRLIILGTASSLYANERRDKKVYEDLPKSLRAPSMLFDQGLDYVREHADFPWIFFAPAFSFDFSRPRSSKILIGRDVLLSNHSGRSVIGYDDYATALVDQIEHPLTNAGMLTLAEA